MIWDVVHWRFGRPVWLESRSEGLKSQRGGWWTPGQSPQGLWATTARGHCSTCCHFKTVSKGKRDLPPHSHPSPQEAIPFKSAQPPGHLHEKTNGHNPRFTALAEPLTTLSSVSLGDTKLLEGTRLASGSPAEATPLQGAYPTIQVVAGALFLGINVEGQG